MTKKKDLIKKEKSKSLIDIIHKDNKNYLNPEIDSEMGLVVNEQHKETIEYFDEQLRNMRNEDGSINLSPLFTKIMGNIATKSTMNEILHQKSSAILLDRLSNDAGMISDKDLIALNKNASQESTASAKEIQSLFNIFEKMKIMEAEQKLEKQKRSATLNQLDDHDRTLVTSILADFQKKLEGEAKKKEEDESMIEVIIPDGK
jgi:hypothetical protein